jgi:opacity protein-like surface antigen
MTSKSALTACMAATAMLLALGAPAQANRDMHSNRDTETTPGSGFYLGGYGGWTWTNADLSGGPGFDVNGGDWGILGGVDIGTFLNKSMNTSLEAAIELHYGRANADDTQTVAAAPVKVRKDHEWGADFRPGLSFISSAMPLGLKPSMILGYRQTEFDTERAATTATDTFHGFALGAGAEMVAWQHAGVRLDYTHVWYGKQNGLDPDEDNLRGALVVHF